MDGRRERMEIILRGGRPWGFSIKGGLENQKNLVISKLESKGKAEASGLYVGDIIFSVNNVPLSGFRSEAIKLVKMSGHTLTLEIERGHRRRNHRGLEQQQQPYMPSRHKPHPQYDQHVPMPQNQDQIYYAENQQKQLAQHPCDNSLYDKRHEYNSPDDHHRFPASDDSRFSSSPVAPRHDYTVAPEYISQALPIENNPNRASPITGAGSAADLSLLSSSPSSVSTFSPSRVSALVNIDRKAIPHDIMNENVHLHSLSNESMDRPDFHNTGHGGVRMRRPRKATDRNFDRPSSWHASKHSEVEKEIFDTTSSSPTSYVYEDRNMRSPGSAVHQNIKPRSHTNLYHQPIHQHRRKSKGWTESEDLKSTLKGEFNGSKDSIISSYSYGSNRLSVSSSKSSGNISSSRGSLDNLDSHHNLGSREYLYDTGTRNLTANGLTSNNSNYPRKNSSPTQLHVGNVGSKKDLFEKLSAQETGNAKLSASRENLHKMLSKHHDDGQVQSNAPWRQQYRDRSKSSTSSGSRDEERSSQSNMSERSSCSPPASQSFLEKSSLKEHRPEANYMLQKFSSQNQHFSSANSDHMQDTVGNVPHKNKMTSSQFSAAYHDLPQSKKMVVESSAKRRQQDQDLRLADAKIVRTSFDPACGIVTIKEVHSTYSDDTSNLGTSSAGGSAIVLSQAISASKENETTYLRQQKASHLSNNSRQRVQSQTDSLAAIRSPTGQVPVFPNSQTQQTAVGYPVLQVSPSIATPVTENHKTIEVPLRQQHQRVYGVMACGKDGENIVAKPIEIQSPHTTPLPSPPSQRSKVESTKELTNKDWSFTQYEHLKDTYTFPVSKTPDPPAGSDYVSRMMMKKQQQQSNMKKQDGQETQNELPPKKFIRADTTSGQGKARASGKYGEIWKTPQIHRRSKSSDSNVLINDQGYNKNPASDNQFPKLSVYKKPLSDQDRNNAELKPSRTLLPSSENHHQSQASLDAKTRKAIYHGSDGLSDEIEKELAKPINDSEPPVSPQQPVQVDYGRSSILQALQHSKKSSEMQKMRKSPEIPSSPQESSNLSRSSGRDSRKKSATLPPGSSPSYKEVDLDDAFMAQPEEYRNNIKGMSKKVLRVTSFTRKDLELSPPIRTFEQRRRVFEYSSKLESPMEDDERTPHFQYVHGRSRSQGDELEQGSAPLISPESKLEEKNSLQVPSQLGNHEARQNQNSMLRPKSAGSQIMNGRSGNSNLHVPKHSQTISRVQRISEFTRNKAGSLPRNIFASNKAKSNSRQLSSKVFQNSPQTSSQLSINSSVTSPEHRRIEVEVRPDNSIQTNTTKPAEIVAKNPQVRRQDLEATKINARNAVLGFYSRKTGKSVKMNQFSSRAKSTSNFFPQPAGTDEKQLSEASYSGDELKNKTQKIRTLPELVITGPSSNTFKQIISQYSVTNSNQRNLPVRAKSTSSLLEDVKAETDASKSKDVKEEIPRQLSELSQDLRSSSLENLTADSITSPVRSTTSFVPKNTFHNQYPESKELSPTRRSRKNSFGDSPKQTIKSNPSSPPSGNTVGTSPNTAVNPPHARRQRNSQSSSASSVTTISTLSSYSSSSSLSFGASSYRHVNHPPTVQEQDDLGQENANQSEVAMNNKNRKSSVGKKESHDIINQPDEKDPTDASTQTKKSQLRIPLSPMGKKTNFNTGTYKIAKGLRSTDPMIKIPVVSPEDFENSVNPDIIGRSEKTQEGDSYREQPSPQVPVRRRRKSDRGSLTSSSSSSTGSNSVVVTSPSRKKSSVTSVEISLSPTRNAGSQKSHRLTPPSSSKSALKFSHFDHMLPLPPPPPPPPTSESLDSEVIREQLRKMGKFPTSIEDLPPPPPSPPRDPEQRESYDETIPEALAKTPHLQIHENTPVANKYREQTYLLGTDSSSDSAPTSKRNSYQVSEDNTVVSVKADKDSSALPQKSPEKEFPDEPLQPSTTQSSLLTSKIMEDFAPSNLTSAIIKNDKSLAQVLFSSNKKTLDYMQGVLAEPSHDIVEAGLRYRRRKPAFGNKQENNEPAKDFQNSEKKAETTTTSSTLPASSTYYQTSASKAKILHIVQEKVDGGEISDDEEIENEDEINRKKVELIASISAKMAELQTVKNLIKAEMKANEDLGKQVQACAKNVCTNREQNKFDTFVQEVDKIINLLLSLSARLARVENALATLPTDAEPEERDSLLKKKEKLTQQHEEAKMLKENVDNKQKAVSDILASYFDEEQFADYEHYIKMKTALIMEQRELDDKLKLGDEQMQCLRDSLPEEWQTQLEKVLEEQAEEKKENNDPVS